MTRARDEMSKIVVRRTRLIANGRLIRDFRAASAPCGILGLLEERDTLVPFFALRPQEHLAQRVGVDALQFGHALLGESPGEVIQFGATLFEISTYHLLVNPNSRIVQAVIDGIVERHYCFLFVIDPDQWMTGFRVDFDSDSLLRFADDRRHLMRSRTSDAEYDWVLRHFGRDPRPPGRLLNWVCRNNPDYLDLSRDRLEINPAH